VDLPDLDGAASDDLIGDQALLRYLTGDLSTPYGKDTAVVVAGDDVEVAKVTIYYNLSDSNGPLSQKNVPAVAARPADPGIQGIFLPAKLVQGLGYHPEPTELITASADAGPYPTLPAWIPTIDTISG
jgi:hypothetical protein